MVNIMANVNIRIDGDLKEKAEAVFGDLGITSTTAITIFYKQVVRTNGIPFSLKISTPNKKTRKAIKEVERLEKKPKEHKTFDSVDSLLKDLKK